MSPDDETQRIRIPQDRPTPMPGPLDLAGPTPTASDGTDTTAVLSLDELFDRAAEPEPEPVPAPQFEQAFESRVEQPAPGAAALVDAPTWTAMPVPQPAAPPAPAAPAPAQPRRRAANELAARVRADARSAWTGSQRRSSEWLRSGDNAVILLTAVVAVLLLGVIAALAR